MIGHSRRWRLAGAGFLLLLIGLTTAATPSRSGPTPPPRITSYQPRVTSYQPRVVAYRPRIADERPRAIAPATPTAPPTLSVPGDILFAFDSATLSPQAESILGEVVERLQTASAGQVVVTGYTDSIGDETYNLQLSQRRATAVQQYLTAHVNRPDLSYSVVGKGEADPVAPNTNPDGSDNPTGRSENRRVTISLPS